jgi:hypothetical protein
MIDSLRGGGLSMDLTGQKKTTKDRPISVYKINLRILASGSVCK